MNPRSIRLAAGGALLFTLCALVYALSRPPPPQPAPEELFLWTSDAETIQSVAVALPRTGQSSAWEKREGGSWHFAVADGARVDQARWAGIPLLVSGVKVDRRIVANADQAALSAYGFDTPAMVVDVGYADGVRRVGEVGNESPSGSGDYVRIAGSAEVFLVTPAWRDVLQRLVTDPPHQKSSASAIAPPTIRQEMAWTSYAP